MHNVGMVSNIWKRSRRKCWPKQSSSLSNRLNRLIKSNKSSLSSWPKAANFKLSIQSDFLSYQNPKSKLRVCYPKVFNYKVSSIWILCAVAVAYCFFSNVSQCPSQRFHRCLEKKLLPPFICRLIDSQHQNNPICFNLCKTMSASLHAVLVQCTHTSLCKVPTSVQSKQKYTHCKLTSDIFNK